MPDCGALRFGSPFTFVAILSFIHANPELEMAKIYPGRIDLIITIDRAKTTLFPLTTRPRLAYTGEEKASLDGLELIFNYFSRELLLQKYTCTDYGPVRPCNSPT